ncbi:hypothetical protein HYW43_04895 [Candidatus Daviesbacteria bacterium]|nr:hypothetical protein [Candidatus Daviesbacteria bacterium]
MSKKILIALIIIVTLRVLLFLNFSVKDWKILIPLLITSLGIILIQKKVKKTAWLFPAIFLLIISANLFNPLELGIRGNPVPIWLVDEQRREHGVNYDNLEVLIMHNKVVNYSLSYLSHYFDYFRGDFLFVNGNFLYLFDALFLILGFRIIITSPRGWESILIWLLAAPVIPALDFQPPNVLKAINMYLPLIIISTFGVLRLINGVKYKRI